MKDIDDLANLHGIPNRIFTGEADPELASSLHKEWAEKHEVKIREMILRSFNNSIEANFAHLLCEKPRFLRWK